MTTAATAETELTTADSGVETEPYRGGRAIPEIVRRRLSTLDRSFDPYSWLVTVVITVIAGILRFAGVDKPKGYIFDEVYYPTDAADMLQHGIEWDEKNNTAAYVVHPPLGKWLIALGEIPFGTDTELGWRFSTAVAGTLMVLIFIRVAYRLFHSIVLAGIAGLLMALDGFQMVLSRTSLLDIFIGLFILMTFAALVLDRDHYRRSWQRALENGYDPSATPHLPRFIPWWLLASGVAFGMACSVKWSALFFAPFFAALVFVWRAQARRSAGVRGPIIAGILGDIGWLALTFGLVFAVYLASWTGWFVTDNGYFRHYRADNGWSEPPIIGALQNLAHYHDEAFRFHTGLTQKHTYQSWPWQWLLLGRPVAFYWSSAGGCGAASCAAEILLVGTPILWWSFLPALGVMAWFGVARRDWRAYAIMTGVVAGLLPWFYFAVKDGRTMFAFYAMPALPFLILAVVYVLGAIMTPTSGMTSGAARTDRQLVGTVVVSTYVILVALCFAYFHPIFVGTVMPYDDWSVRMWLGGRWI
ncbi:dolichyl-phosphate-mannose--protein mannosyltransferase [Actinoplanes sp. CA-252034]|uniref:dolichyl-phosphate-mannose--protein mannosyltransferase n=1 Tax=Actinoplanes sp. CA-252034 TaxID=3239906 RepID=UPI003D9567A9